MMDDYIDEKERMDIFDRLMKQRENTVHMYII